MVYCMPCRASSLTGGTQHARSAAYISAMESKDFASCCLSPVASASLPCLVLSASGGFAELSSVETIVKRRSCPIGGRICGKHGSSSKTLQGSTSGSAPTRPGASRAGDTRPSDTPPGAARPGGTGTGGGFGTVLGVDGLKTGGGGGGGGPTKPLARAAFPSGATGIHPAAPARN